MNKAVFLDRDGVVNVERGEYTWKLEDFRMTIGLVPFLKEIQQRGYLVIIISNQGGIGKGIYSHEDVALAHDQLICQLHEHGIILTDIYYCPHHPSVTKCLCRKPESVMLEKAIARYKVDASHSYFIGDSLRDIEAGEKVNLKTILIKPNDDLCNYLSEIKP